MPAAPIDSVVTQLRAALDARRVSLLALRWRLAHLLEPLPAGVVLVDGEGVVCRVVRVCAGTPSTPPGRAPPLEGKGALSPAGRLLCDDLAVSIEAPRRLCDSESGRALQAEFGELTRELAERLPGALERYMERCESERELNATTLAE